jgi:MYXO-CTERM domain-containing protein
MTPSLSKALGLPLLCLSFCASAWAAPLPSNLSITGTISLDTVNSSNLTGGATQTGTLTLISGGTSTTFTFSGNPAGLSPSELSGGLISTGDGIGASFQMGGSTPGAHNFDGLFADYTLTLANTSATIGYFVTFRGVISNTVSASGADSFASTKFSVINAAIEELIYADRDADTVSGTQDSISASPSSSFRVEINPGQTLTFTALQKIRGGVYADGAFSANQNAMLMVSEVSAVPEPLTSALALAGLGTLALLRRRA